MGSSLVRWVNPTVTIKALHLDRFYLLDQWQKGAILKTAGMQTIQASQPFKATHFWTIRDDKYRCRREFHIVRASNLRKTPPRSPFAARIAIVFSSAVADSGVFFGREFDCRWIFQFCIGFWALLFQHYGSTKQIRQIKFWKRPCNWKINLVAVGCQIEYARVVFRLFVTYQAQCVICRYGPWRFWCAIRSRVLLVGDWPIADEVLLGLSVCLIFCEV